MIHWYGLELDIEPYLKEKERQGLVWDVEPSPLVSGNADTRHIIPTCNFRTHAGTFYNVILPQLRESKKSQALACSIQLYRITEGGWRHCDPFMQHNLPDDTEMLVQIKLKHPKQ